MNPEHNPERIKTKEIGVKKETGETLFEGLFNFEPPTPEDLKEIFEYKEKLKEFKEPFSFRTEERENALKIIKEENFEQNRIIDLIEKSLDFIVRDIAIEWLDELNNLSKENIDRLKVVLKEGKWKGKDRDLAKKIKEKIEQVGKEGVEAEISANENKFSLEKAVKNIEKLKGDLGDMGDKPWAYLYPKEEENIKAIKEIIVNMAEREGEKAIPALKKFSQDKNSYVAWLAAQMLARIIKTRDENVLEETFEGYSKEIKDAVNFEKKQMPWLLATKDRFLATGDRKNLVEGLLGVKKMEQQLKERWGDKIIGITTGSGGGYFTKGLSDIDFAIIVKEEASKDMFDEHGSKIPGAKIKGIADLHERFVSVDENNKAIPFDGIPYLFSGRLLETSPEDRQRFSEVQKSTLRNFNEDKWDAVRKMYRDDEADAVEKMGMRFGINEKNLKKLRQIIFIRDIPPTLKETLEILESKNIQIDFPENGSRETKL